MNISKLLFLITLTLFLFTVSGCSKNLQPTVKPETSAVKAESDADFLKEENVGEFDTSSETGDQGKERKGLLNKDRGDKDKTQDSVEPFSPVAEPFLHEKDEGAVALLSPEEESRRHLPYRSSNKLLDMFFAFDSYDLDDQLLTILKENADYLKSHPFSKIVIQGHCDERGSNNYNLSLGIQRAHSVKSYLILLGIDETKIHIISYGEEKPSCFENNEKCWHQNRRVSFLLDDKKENAESDLISKTNSLVMLEK
jgi:peptidoglycan-associated lipoprotein